MPEYHSQGGFNNRKLIRLRFKIVRAYRMVRIQGREDVFLEQTRLLQTAADRISMKASLCRRSSDLSMK